MRPMEIYEQIIFLNLYIFKAQNPVHIVSNQLRRHCENLTFPTARKDKYFIRLSDGRYALKNHKESRHKQDFTLLNEESDHLALDTNLDSAYNLYRESFKTLLLEELKSLTAEQFEIFSKNFIKNFGFSDVQVTQRGKDGGIDGYGTLNIGISQLHVAFQCKRWKGKTVGIKPVNEFLGSISGMQKDGIFYDQGFFFTTSEFTNDAKKVTKRKGAVPLVLVDGVSLVEFMLQKGIGVSIKPLTKFLVSLDEMINDED